MNKFIFDRSDLDEVVAVIPKGHPDNQTDKAIQVTRREDLERNKACFERNDIVLINGTNTGRQYSLHPTVDGFSGDLFLFDFLTDDEVIQVNSIAERMRQNAKDFPPAAKLLG